LKSGALRLEETKPPPRRGKIRLPQAYVDAFHVLIWRWRRFFFTLDDTEERRRYLNRCARP